MRIFQKTHTLYFLSAITLAIVVAIVVAVVLYQQLRVSRDEVSPSEARQFIREGKYDVIVDVRTETEWDEDHLPNTISVPIGVLVTELPDKIPDRQTRILFVCKKGIRARGVVEIAHKLGYTNVHAMMGNYRDLV